MAGDTGASGERRQAVGRNGAGNRGETGSSDVWGPRVRVRVMPPRQRSLANRHTQHAARPEKRQSDLLSGFAAQILKSPKKVRLPAASQLSSRSLEIDDAIEISSGEEGSPRDGSRIGPRAKRRLSAEARSGPGGKRVRVKEEPLELLEGIQRTEIEAEPRRSVATQTEEHGDSSWLDLYPPRSSAELAVHKRKVSDVQEWLKRSFRNIAEKTVLVLTGSAGVGKTAVVQVLSREMDYDVIEWRNPMSIDASFDRDADSLAQKFERFLAISDKYSALDFGDQTEQTEARDNRRKVIVVEDIPNTFSSSSTVSSAKIAFQNSITRYLTSPRNKYPLVLIITETEPRGEDGDWRRTDAMSTRNLLTRSILDSPNCSLISFNDVAPTFISKALVRIVDSLPRRHAVDISQAVIDEIAQNANGDIRSAINTLEFISHRFGTGGRAPKARRKRKRGEVLALTKEETAILNIVTNRESALGYFHAIGKVVYNKRIPASLDRVPYDDLPVHLASEARPRPENSPSAILEETSTDVPTFFMGVHQNYLASCASVEQAAGVLDALGQVDALTAGFAPSTGLGACATAGLAAVLHALPVPVSRPHAQRVYFPSLAALLRRRRAIEDALEREGGGGAGVTNSTSGAVHGASSTGRRVDLLDALSYEHAILGRRGTLTDHNDDASSGRRGDARRRARALAKVVLLDRSGGGGGGLGVGGTVDDGDAADEDDDDVGGRERIGGSVGAANDKDRTPARITMDEVLDDEIEEVD